MSTQKKRTYVTSGIILSIVYTLTTSVVHVLTSKYKNPLPSYKTTTGDNIPIKTPDCIM
ncbi:hypothetical protein [Lacrimispora sphenoides]|uniref:hypothetical protein n=1 Tax=Lacrimispora sphenoides TaxID=29370 RepID=UPI00140A0BDA|nr:hypothetical protein [Lacrimispora sphenoides]